MRTWKLFLLCCFFVGGCGEETPQTPQSPRAHDIIEQIRPRLRKEFKRRSLTLGDPIFLRIFKESKELEMWVEDGKSFTLFAIYPIYYFSGTLGLKTHEGDKQAPEGFYYVAPSLMNPRSRFHLAFNIGYPNQYDRVHHRTGSAIMVHGNTVSIGCFAMTDAFIEEIYTIADMALNNGRPFFRVHIFPFRMTENAMREHSHSPYIDFWKNLHEGYLFFEHTKRPPNIEVKNGRYIFEEDGNGS